MGNTFIMQFTLILIIVGSGIKNTQCFWPPSYKVDLKDKQTFIISSGEDYDENENEMLKPEDLKGIKSLVEDEPKYEPLHSHVENYNHQVDEAAAVRFSKIFPVQPIMESPFEEVSKPFIAGFKDKLDKYNFDKLEVPDHSFQKRSAQDDGSIFKKLFSTTLTIKDLEYVNNNHKRIKRIEVNDPSEYNDPSSEFFKGLSNRYDTVVVTTEEKIMNSIQNLDVLTPILSSTENDLNIDFENMDLILVSSTHPDPMFVYPQIEISTPEGKKEEEEGGHFSDGDVEKTASSDTERTKDYNYDKLKAEYYNQIEEIQRRNETFNDIKQEEAEETVKDSVKKIVDFKMPKNCTKEELSQVGVKAIECLIYDYQHAKNETEVKKVFNRTLMVIRVWILIYICVAIPCWCQKGWCCCCFCCKICFPNEIIEAEKKYFAENPPGTLVKRIREDQKVKKETTNYKPSLFEYEAYERLESAIRNI